MRKLDSKINPLKEECEFSIYSNLTVNIVENTPSKSSQSQHRLIGNY